MIEAIRKDSLILSDIDTNTNKYYILELIKSNESFVLIRRDGNLGNKPTIVKTSTSNRISAIKEYEKVLDKILRKGYNFCYLEDIIYSDGSYYNS